MPNARARAKKKLQRAFNGLVKEIILAKPFFKEESKSNQAFEVIGANKEVQKSMNVIMDVDGNIHMILASKRTRKSKEICALDWLHNSCTIKDLFWGVFSIASCMIKLANSRANH